MKHYLALALSLFALCAGACGGKDTPSSPTPTPTPTATRIIRLGGNLNFGNVTVGEVRSDGLLTISNDGNATLTYASISAPCGSTGISGSPTTGTVAPGQTQNVTIRFAPTTAGSCSGTITVAGDQTSGTNSIPMVAVGVPIPRELFTRSGTGDTVFDMPLDVARIRIQAVPTTSCQNFVVRIAGRASLVNVILGTCSIADARTLDSTYLTGGGGVVQITISTGVQWTITEVR